MIARPYEISTGRYVSIESTFFATVHQLGHQAITETIAVSLNRLDQMLLSGGSTRRIDCGRITRRIACHCDIPRASAGLALPAAD